MSRDFITIASDGLRAEINPLGAELSRLTDAQGRELLWDGDPAFWTGRAPILFPIVGSLNGGRYRLDGRQYAMDKHGFARRRRFAVVETAADRATLRLSADEETRTAYPFDFHLDLTFAMAGARLSMTAQVRNLDARPMPFSFGFHPALRWPLPYGGDRADHRLLFEQDEPAAIRRVGPDGLVKPDAPPPPMQGRELLLRDDLFTDDAVIFDQLHSRSLDYGVAGGPQVKAGFPDTPHLGVWTKPGAGYVCIEPWQGFSDPAGFDGDIWDKPGIVVLPPGQTKTFTMTIAAPAV